MFRAEHLNKKNGTALNLGGKAAAPLVYEKSSFICSAINVPKRKKVVSIRYDVGKNKVPNYKRVPYLGFMTAALRFMSNLYLAVEKVTESLVRNIKVKLSFVLTANDKHREGVARSVRPLLTYLPMSNGN